MIIKKQPIGKLSLHRRIFGLTTHDLMKIEAIKHRILSVLLLRRILERKGLPCTAKIARCNKLVKLLCLQYVQLAFYDDSALSSKHYLHHRRRIRITDFEEQYLHEMFRFRNYEQLRRIITCFQLPPTVILSNGSVFTNEEILLVSLYRFHFPCTFAEHSRVFSIDHISCSRIFDFFLTFMTENGDIYY